MQVGILEIYNLGTTYLVYFANILYESVQKKIKTPSLSKQKSYMPFILVCKLYTLIFSIFGVVFII